MVEASAWVKGWKSLVRCSSAHAYPCVADLEEDRGPIGGVFGELGPEGHLALFGELDRVPQDVGEDLPQPEGVAPNGGRRAGLDEACKLQALLVGASREQGGDLLDLPPELEV